MKQLLSLIATLLLSVLSIHATGTGIDMATASKTAMDFLSSRAGTCRVTSSTPRQLWVHEQRCNATGQTAFYIVSTDQGFVVVSGDSRVRQVLAYSDYPLEDYDAMPAAMQFWLELYKRQFEYLLCRPDLDSPVPMLTADGSRAESVAPLLKSQWGQTNPYNFQCPKVDGLLTQAGCSAIALAQVMRYWEFPTSCDSLPAYTTHTLELPVPALDSTTFEWPLILDRYRIGGDHTTEQLSAVNKLLRYVGQAEQMDYRTSASDADEDDILRAIRFFGYDMSALYVEKSSIDGVTYYSDAIWEVLLRNELYNSRPVIYCGYSLSNDSIPKMTGHAFNVDGYDADNDLYHVNFGWRGNGDGYYALNAFAANNYNFNIGQLMFLKVMPPHQAPVLLPADSATITTSSFRAQWIDNTTPRLVDYYELEVSTTADFNLDDDGYRLISDLTATCCDVDSLTSGTTYYYRVWVAYNDGADWECSNVETVTLPEPAADLEHGYALGDCNHDGIFGIADLTFLIDHILDRNNWVCPICADVKPDGVIEIGDVTTMIDLLLATQDDSGNETEPSKP